MLVNNMCEIEGVRPTIELIMEYGYTEEKKVEEFGFDADDVQAVLDGNT